MASATQSQWTRTAELAQGHINSERHLLESGHLAASNKKLTNASVRKGKRVYWFMALNSPGVSDLQDTASNV